MKFIMVMLFSISFLFGAVDINTASAKELSSLKGIGLKKAKAIVEYRKIHCFKNINELSKVKGIGAKIIEKNKTNLSASACK